MNAVLRFRPIFVRSMLWFVTCLSPFAVCFSQNQLFSDSLKMCTDQTFPVVKFNYSLRLKHTDTTLNLGLNMVQDLEYVVSSPFRWDGKSWAAFGGVLGGTALIYAFDKPLYESMDFMRGGSVGYVTRYFLEPIGDYRVQLGALAGVYAYGWIGKNEKAKDVAVLAGEALLISGAITQFAKFVSGRQRPLESNPPDPYVWMGVNHHSSFWSGHAATSFAIASVFAGIYKDQIWVPITSYSLASLVALSRVYDGKHWTSDVFIGSAVGVVVGQMVVRNYKTRAVKISPYYTGQLTGVRASYTF